MARTEKRIITEVSYTCEKRTCDETLTVYIPDYAQGDTFRAVEFADEDANLLGWSCWVNRGRRYYCPDHEPTTGRQQRGSNWSENRKVWG